MLKRFAVLLSQQGYEMSVPLPDGPIEQVDEDRAKKHVTLMYAFTNPGAILNNWELNSKVTSYKINFMNKQAKEKGDFDIGSMMAYNLRKNMATVVGQKEYIFALNQSDMDWIYTRNPIDAGIIFCELFIGTESDEWIDKKIEERKIIGINKCEDKYWNSVKYDLEDFYDIYKVKKQTIERRKNRGV